MYKSISQLKQYNPEEAHKVLNRWETEFGKETYEYIIELIRKGGGEHFLESDFQRGKYDGLLEDEYDLRGFKFWQENIEFPKTDNFNAIDFSYSKFWHSSFINACWHATFYFVRFYNCKFINCQFHYSTFLGCTFEKCQFVNCDFIEGDLFSNCSFESTNFENMFLGNQILNDCRLSSDVIIQKPIDVPNDKGWKEVLDKKSLSSFYLEISQAYRASGDIDNQWKNNYKSQYYFTRYNSKNNKEKYFRLIFKELLIGYGEKPFNSLIASIFVVIFFSILLMYSGVNISNYDSVGNYHSYLINYDLNSKFFFSHFFQFDFHLRWIKDLWDIFFFNFQSFTVDLVVWL